MDYRREVDGLRALAVTPVILFHAGFDAFSGGFVGVDIFFVISGYLITSIIIDELRVGKFSIARFYERRVRRILPALFLVMAASLPFAWLWLLPSEMLAFSHSLIAVPTFVSNILFWRESGYFEAEAELKPLLHTWSLAAEEQFYLLFPLVLIFAWKYGTRFVLGLLFVLFLGSLAIAQWGATNSPTAAFFLLPTRGWELVLGAFIAFYLSERNQPPTSLALNQILGLLGAALIAYSIFAFSHATPFPGFYALIPTIGTALILLFAWPQTYLGKILSSKIFVGIGLVSYSAYLWHQPLFAFARHRSIEPPGAVQFVILALLTLLLALLTWRFVEQPFRNKQLFTRKTVFLSAFTASILFIAIGSIGSITQGFLARYPEPDRYLASISTIDSGEYVKKRFVNLMLKRFDPDDKRLKILIVGDSFAQDLVNAVYEGGLINRVQLSTHYIPVHCANLHIEKNNPVITHAQNSSACRKIKRSTDPEIASLMKEADAIWLVSSWRAWQVEYLPPSIAHLENVFKNRVLVFGRKHFGDVDRKAFLAMSPETRLNAMGVPNQPHMETQKIMQSVVAPEKFIDVDAIFCTEGLRCKLFDESGRLRSFDGAHLTPEGARYLGQRLIDEPLINQLFNR